MAYGVNAPFGLQPVRTLTGACWNGQANPYVIDATAGNLYKGDPVKMMANGSIQPAAAGDTAMGVFMGCKYAPLNPLINDPQTYSYWLNGTQLQANTVPVAMVVDDPNTVFAIQVNAGGILVQGSIGANANWVAAAGDPVAGSGYSLDFGTIGNGVNLNMKLIGFYPSQNNGVSSLQRAPVQVSFNVAEVLINNHFYRGGTAGVV